MSARFRSTGYEILAGLRQRLPRTVLTSLGVGLGATAYVVAVVLSASASSTVAARFDERRVRDIDVVFNGDSDVSPFEGLPLIDVVEDGGELWSVGSHELAAIPYGAPLGSTTIIGADAGALRASGARVSDGRPFLSGDALPRARTALVGRSVFDRLELPAVQAASSVVYVDGLPFEVVGVIESVRTNAALLSSVVVSTDSADRHWTPVEAYRIVVRVEAGTAHQAAQLLPIVLSPGDPDGISVLLREDTLSLEGEVEDDLAGLVAVLSVVALLVGALSVGNTMLISVAERIPEIGLRRALGARRAEISAQFLGECTFVGIAGGVLGVCVGLIVSISLVLARGWVLSMPGVHIAAGIPIGGTVGLLAGLYPALRASQVEPATALRQP